MDNICYYCGDYFVINGKDTKCILCKVNDFQNNCIQDKFDNNLLQSYLSEIKEKMNFIKNNQLKPIDEIKLLFEIIQLSYDILMILNLNENL